MERSIDPCTYKGQMLLAVERTAPRSVRPEGVEANDLCLQGEQTHPTPTPPWRGFVFLEHLFLET